jgi:hypothetical protein
MSKFIQLLRSAYVNGVMRHPQEGVLHLEDDEAKRLLDHEAAQDVTSDFSAEQKKSAPIEAISAHQTDVDAALKMAPHETQAAQMPEPIPAPAKTKEPSK